MLWQVLAMTLFLFVSVTSRSSIETTEQIELAFGIGLYGSYLPHILHCVKRKLVYVLSPKIRVSTYHIVWNFRKLRFGMSMAETFLLSISYRLSSTKVDA